MRYGVKTPLGLPNKRKAVVPSLKAEGICPLTFYKKEGDAMEYFTVITLVIILLLILSTKK